MFGLFLTNILTIMDFIDKRSEYKCIIKMYSVWSIYLSFTFFLYALMIKEVK